VNRVRGWEHTSDRLTAVEIAERYLRRIENAKDWIDVMLVCDSAACLLYEAEEGECDPHVVGICLDILYVSLRAALDPAGERIPSGQTIGEVPRLELGELRSMIDQRLGRRVGRPDA
jgi:hypothetical protein